VLDAEDREAWLRLTLNPGLGRAAMRRLLAAFGSAGHVLQAGAGAWREVAGAAAAQALATPDATLAPRVDAAQRWLAESAGRSLVTLADAAYPPLLLQTPDPPLLLYLHGRPELLAAPALAMVGSRNATTQGLDNARAFAAHLSGEGWTIVSGLAQGIDGAAHEGGLKARGSTVAVVGQGLDRVYPRQHHELARRIAAEGLLLSEFCPGTPPLPTNFPQRNRIIAGLARGVLVVEAALRSGSLITARLAAEHGREVFAVPGSIHSPQARGCHALIREGAKLVESAADLLEELGPALAPRALPITARTPVDDSPAAPEPLLDAMGHDPVSLDALGARTGWPTSELLAKLLELELDGQVERRPGGLFQRRHRA
jgi:DNA processing protein